MAAPLQIDSFIMSSSLLLLVANYFGSWICSTDAAAVSVCFSGYVMDTFCIEQGTLVENPAIQTLSSTGPSQHSLHCLIDMAQCVAEWEMLRAPATQGGNYCRAFKIDAASQGFTDAVNLGKATGSTTLGCTTCGTSGTLERGLQLTVRGTYDDAAMVSPRVLTVTSVGLADAETCSAAELTVVSDADCEFDPAPASTTTTTTPPADGQVSLAFHKSTNLNVVAVSALVVWRFFWLQVN